LHICSLLVIRDDSWVHFCAVIGRPELATDQRFIDGDARALNEAELMAIVRLVIATKPTAYWAERLREADIMHERLNGFREFLEHPQADAIGLISWLEPDGPPAALPMANIAGVAPFASASTRVVTPVLVQHFRRYPARAWAFGKRYHLADGARERGSERHVRRTCVKRQYPTRVLPQPHSHAALAPSYV
jgi:hypothetical protein